MGFLDYLKIKKKGIENMSNEEILNITSEKDTEGKKSKDELVDEIFQAGLEATHKTLDEHYNIVNEIQDSMSLSNEQLLTTNLTINRELPKKFHSQVLMLGERIRRIIRAIAEKIEEENFKSVEEIISNIKYTKLQQKNITDLISAQKQIHISYESITLAVKLFCKINENLLEQIETSRKYKDYNQEADFLLKNAILVYELANAVVNFLEDFQIEGLDAINYIHQEIATKIKNNKQEDEKLKERCKSEELSPKIRSKTLETIESREEMRKIVEEQWKEFLHNLKQVEDNSNIVKRKVPDLEMVRDNAKNQLGFLQIMAITKMMKDNLDAIKGLLEIEDIPLAPITPENLCNLLGIEKREVLLEK